MILLALACELVWEEKKKDEDARMPWTDYQEEEKGRWWRRRRRRSILGGRVADYEEEEKGLPGTFHT